MKDHRRSVKREHRERELTELRTKQLTKSQRPRFEKKKSSSASDTSKENRDDIFDWDIALVALDSSEGEEENDQVGTMKKPREKKGQQPLSPTSTNSSFTDFTTSSGKTIPVRGQQPLSPTSTHSSFTDFTTNSGKTIPIKNSRSRIEQNLAKNALLQISEEAIDDEVILPVNHPISEQLTRIAQRNPDDKLFAMTLQTRDDVPDSNHKGVSKGVADVGSVSIDQAKESFDDIAIEDPEDGLPISPTRKPSHDSTAASTVSNGANRSNRPTQSFLEVAEGNKTDEKITISATHSKGRKDEKKRNSGCWPFFVVFVVLAVGVGCLAYFVVYPILEQVSTDSIHDERATSLKTLAISLSGTDILEDVQSAQNKAWQWLGSLDGAELGVEYSPYRELVERYVAAVLFYELSGSAWSENYNFLSSDHVCNWNKLDEANNLFFGIGCNKRGNIVEIILTDNNLIGTIPSEISNLRSLQSLKLSQNLVAGSIPSSIGLLEDLQVVVMRSNRLEGSIPTELNALSKLEVLELSSNRFSGSIPDIFEGLVALTTLGLGDNNFSGTVPSSISSLQNLSSLNLFHNQLEGDIVSVLEPLGGLTNLNLAANIFEGDFTGSICESEMAFSQFWADCRGDEPRVQCSCCTICCRGHGDSLEC